MEDLEKTFAAVLLTPGYKPVFEKRLVDFCQMKVSSFASIGH